jgi:hypothetical protein
LWLRQRGDGDDVARAAGAGARGDRVVLVDPLAVLGAGFWLSFLAWHGCCGACRTVATT